MMRKVFSFSSFTKELGLLFEILVIVCLLILVATPLPSVVAFNASLNNNNSTTTSISTIISNEANKVIAYTIH